MRKLSVFYEHILQACEQSGKTIPEVLAFCREQGISAVEMNYSLFASEREVIAPMLSDAGLVISCMHETFDFSHDTDLGRAQQMLDTAASQQVSRVLFVAGALETAEAAELAACSSTYEATSTFMAENKSKLATTSSTGGLLLALQRAIVTARPKGRYRKHFCWPAIKRYYSNLLVSILLLALLYTFELLHLLYCQSFQHNIL